MIVFEGNAVVTHHQFQQSLVGRNDPTVCKHLAGVASHAVLKFAGINDMLLWVI